MVSCIARHMDAQNTPQNIFLFHHTPSAAQPTIVAPSCASESSDLMALYKLVFNYNFNFTS